MDWKRGFGVSLMLIGLFITLTSKTITGAVIGFQPINYLGVFGVFIFVLGIFLIIVSKGEVLEKEIDKEETVQVDDPISVYYSIF